MTSAKSTPSRNNNKQKKKDLKIERKWFIEKRKRKLFFAFEKQRKKYFHSVFFTQDETKRNESSSYFPLLCNDYLYGDNFDHDL